MQDLCCDIGEKVSLPSTATVTETETCSLAFEMTGNDVLRSDFVEQEESSIMESQKKESSEWTNEKHSLYLKSIEASFVDQLYNSLGMQNGQTRKTSSSNAISSWKHHTSGQFKVLQGGGCWSKKKFIRENSQMKDSERSPVSSSNPWIQHFTNGNRTLSNANSQQNPVPESQFYQESGCSNTEVTDQNFVEELSIEKPNRKRTRTTIVANSSNDQVVPFRTSTTTAKK